MRSRAPAAHRVPFRAAVRVWARVAALSAGGRAGQIGVMHRIPVEEQRWISEGRFLLTQFVGSWLASAARAGSTRSRRARSAAR